MYGAKLGSLNFFQTSDHVITFFYGWFAVTATLLAWKMIEKFEYSLPIRVVWAFLSGLIIYWVLATLFYIAIRIGYYGLQVDAGFLIRNIIFSFSLAYLHISGLTLAWLYFRTSRDLAVKKEELEKEIQVLQKQLLSKNLEPHFLMNTLSFLSSMMKTKPEEAEMYVDTFADVYRYFLKHNTTDLVPLQEEMKFLQNYILLMEKRFGKAYRYDIQIAKKSGYVLPFSLQMCVENAVKHNEGNLKEPLLICLSRKNGCIQISNQIEPSPNVLSMGRGLDNLRKRIRLILDSDLNIQTDNGFYKVDVPIVEEIPGVQKARARL
jgi:uncharacterized membrane protein YciS (DUF1049 family)